MPKTLVKPSETIEEQILAQLRHDSRVDAADVYVTVRDDTVILTGNVPSLAARQAAEADAAVLPGVRAVDNRLTVRHRRARAPGDREIRSRIRDSLRWNSSLDYTKITVTVMNGIVTLNGTAVSLWQKFKAQDIAENTAGVVDVDNELTVVPSEYFTDDLITEEVTSALLRNLRLAPGSFEVIVEDGIVTLSGSVPDLSTYRAAESISYYIQGVINVKNNMVIELSSF